MLNKELEAFSYTVSHDLRAPLRTITGFAQILAKRLGNQPDSEADLALERIRAGAKNMGELIDGLLSFSRLGRQPLSKSSIEPEHLARQAVDELKGELNGRRVEIEISPLPPCEADKTLLQQVFINLLSNALKYTRGRDPAIVKLGARTEGGECVYFVQDNGAGFDMEYSHRLFRVFHRLHSMEEFEGTGVGLALVQRIIQRHGGRIWAEAEVDRGATFYFTMNDGNHNSQGVSKGTARHGVP